MRLYMVASVQQRTPTIALSTSGLRSAGKVCGPAIAGMMALDIWTVCYVGRVLNDWLDWSRAREIIYASRAALSVSLVLTWICLC